MFNPFRLFFPKKMIGVDIGTSSIKIVEISHWGGGRTLENYGEIKAMSLYEDHDPFRNFAGSNYLLSDFFVSRAIKAVLEESGIKTKAAVFSIPDYSTFSTSFELPPMAEKEISEAVRYHAPQYIPLPSAETTLDWQLINGTPGDKKSKLEILLTAIPNQILQSYKKVADNVGLELYSIEAEALAITRALLNGSKKTICLIDIGVQSTTINIVDKGHLKKSYSSSFAGGQLNYAIASSFGMSRVEAEEIKNSKGLIDVDKNITKALYLLIDPLLFEVKKVSSDFFQSTGKNIEEIYLTGGTANLPGLKEYFQESIGKKVLIPNCFSKFLYPPILDETLKEMGPSFSVSVGAALGGLEG
jgi:type IV pilus assembly protein PilM